MKKIKYRLYYDKKFITETYSLKTIEFLMCARKREFNKFSIYIGKYLLN